ncbi:hypothetical protein [Micromonospora sp. U21]|uniref:hypothetical protein n=1 Tax=Micromonospora sp. U21 TaxID=2824899 RepID=UPI001B3956BB|nr:hypothetical protein [Micromonospora sp. U21]MBQ0905481.1 hypothetical protein [Micromonospora sp. U21]
MIRLVAEDPAVRLDADQVLRIQFWILETLPALGCHVRPDPPIEVIITKHFADEVHPPLLEQVEAVAGCRFRVTASAD